MAAWKRDFASGLVVLVPVLVTAYVVAWLYGAVVSVAPASVVEADVLQRLGLQGTGELVSVAFTVVVFVVSVFAVGYLMRTTVGSVVEQVVDGVANRLPGLRVVYNASKMAAETALGGTDSLQTPVKIETWNGLRMTAFKTGKTTDDGREVLFLPTAPNITTGFVVEVDPGNVTETDETVEDALTRILSAGFGDNSRSTVSIQEVVGDGEVTADDTEVDPGDPDPDPDPERSPGTGDD